MVQTLGSEVTISTFSQMPVVIFISNFRHKFLLMFRIYPLNLRTRSLLVDELRNGTHGTTSSANRLSTRPSPFKFCKTKLVYTLNLSCQFGVKQATETRTPMVQSFRSEVTISTFSHTPVAILISNFRNMFLLMFRVHLLKLS